jgi:hypothetical protein
MAHDAHPPGVAGLLAELRTYGVEPVRHGGFVGLRGQAVGQVPDPLWAALRREAPLLRRLVRPEPTPFAVRKARGLA